MSIVCSFGYKSLRISVVLKLSTYFAFSNAPICNSCSFTTWSRCPTIPYKRYTSRSSNCVRFYASRRLSSIFRVNTPTLSSLLFNLLSYPLRFYCCAINRSLCSSTRFNYTRSRPIVASFSDCSSTNVNSLSSSMSSNLISTRLLSSKCLSFSRPNTSLSSLDRLPYSSLILWIYAECLADNSTISFSERSFCSKHSCSRFIIFSRSSVALRSYIRYRSATLFACPCYRFSNIFSFYFTPRACYTELARYCVFANSNSCWYFCRTSAMAAS